MLGLADRGRIRACSSWCWPGDADAALAELDEAHELGIDPTQLLRGLMESLHAATRAKAGASADCAAMRRRARRRAEMAQQLSWGTIHRLWQMLLKGLAGCRDRARSSRGGRNGTAAADPCRRHARSGLVDRQAERRGRCRRVAVGRRAGGEPRPEPPRALPADFPALIRRLEQAGKHHARGPAPRPGRAGSLCAARTGAEAHASAWRGLVARPRACAQGRDRAPVGRCRCRTMRASHRCSTRRKLPRNGFAPTCSPIQTCVR